MQPIFEPQNILFTKDYEFDGDSLPKNKITIVLKVDEGNMLLVQALTTSQQKVPDENILHGCVNVEADFLSFFCFLKGRKVGIDTSGDDFIFDKNTYIYFQSNLSIVSTESYTKKYERNVKLLAILSDTEYKRFIKCLRQSKFVNRRIKKYFLV